MLMKFALKLSLSVALTIPMFLFASIGLRTLKVYDPIIQGSVLLISAIMLTFSRDIMRVDSE